MSKLNGKWLYCPVCGPTSYPSHLFKGIHECYRCKWRGRKKDLWGPYENPHEQWLNEQRSKKLKEILD
jgi:hypothetical protein